MFMESMCTCPNVSCCTYINASSVCVTDCNVGKICACVPMYFDALSVCLDGGSVGKICACVLMYFDALFAWMVPLLGNLCMCPKEFRCLCDQCVFDIIV